MSIRYMIRAYIEAYLRPSRSERAEQDGYKGFDPVRSILTSSVAATKRQYPLPISQQS